MKETSEWHPHEYNLCFFLYYRKDFAAHHFHLTNQLKFLEISELSIFISFLE